MAGILGGIKGGQKMRQDYASRMARAKEQGFDTDRVLYHHTEADNIEEFMPSSRGKLGAGVYTSPNPQYGERYVDQSSGSANVLPLLARGPLAKVADIDTASAASRNSLLQSGEPFNVRQWKASTDDILKEKGFAGKEVGEEVSTFNPKDLRSVNAAFDPAKKDSSNILASVGGLGLLAAGSEDSFALGASPYENPLVERGQKATFDVVKGMVVGLLNDAVKYGSQAVTGESSDNTVFDKTGLTGDAAVMDKAINSAAQYVMNYEGWLGSPAELMQKAVTAWDEDVRPNLVDAFGESNAKRVEGAGLLAMTVGIPTKITKLPRGIEKGKALNSVDDRKFMQPVMDDFTIDAERLKYDKPSIYLPDYEGRNALLTMADRTPTGHVIHGVKGQTFAEPLTIGGGRDYMFNEDLYPGNVWANAPGTTKAIQNKFGSDQGLILPMEMANTSVDFPTEAPSLHIKYAQQVLTDKEKKYVEQLIRAGGDGKLTKSQDSVAIPDFSMDKDNLGEYLGSLSGPQRKTINNVFDMLNKPSRAQSKKGIKPLNVLSNTEMRMAITDPDILGQPSLMQLNNVGLYTGGLSSSGHNTYQSGLLGTGLGKLDVPREGPVTAMDFMPEVFPRSTPDYIDSKDAYTARMGVRTAPITEGLLRRLGY